MNYFWLALTAFALLLGIQALRRGDKLEAWRNLTWVPFFTWQAFGMTFQEPETRTFVTSLVYFALGGITASAVVLTIADVVGSLRKVISRRKAA